MAEKKIEETKNEQVMVKVKVPRTKADQEDKFVSVNNYTCIIKRGEWVEVPDFVAEVLEHEEKMLDAIMEAHFKGKK